MIYVFLDIPFNSFRIFGFLDDTAFCTNSPGMTTQRALGFIDDAQRAFYLGYFKGHGVKAQVISFPNGMVGNMFLASIRNIDRGLLNMSNLNGYLSSLFDMV